jgi:hypothetical protein
MAGHYRRIQLLIPALFALYAAIAMGGGIYSDKLEIFPFFNWSLFSHVKDSRTLYEIEVLAIDGVRLDAPTRFAALPDRFAAAQRKSTGIVKLATRMAKATERGDRAQFEKLRMVLETVYLGEAQQLTYRLVALTYNPIERWRDGSVRSATVLGEYSIDGSSR